MHKIWRNEAWIIAARRNPPQDRSLSSAGRPPSLDAAIRLSGVFGINSVPEDSYEAGVGTRITFVDDTKLRGLYDHGIIELRFRTISVALNYELKEISGNVIIKSLAWAHAGN